LKRSEQKRIANAIPLVNALRYYLLQDPSDPNRDSLSHIYKMFGCTRRSLEELSAFCSRCTDNLDSLLDSLSKYEDIYLDETLHKNQSSMIKYLLNRSEANGDCGSFKIFIKTDSDPSGKYYEFSDKRQNCHLVVKRLNQDNFPLEIISDTHFDDPDHIPRIDKNTNKLIRLAKFKCPRCNVIKELRLYKSQHPKFSTCNKCHYAISDNEIERYNLNDIYVKYAKTRDIRLGIVGSSITSDPAYNNCHTLCWFSYVYDLSKYNLHPDDKCREEFDNNIVNLYTSDKIDDISKLSCYILDGISDDVCRANVNITKYAFDLLVSRNVLPSRLNVV